MKMICPHCNTKLRTFKYEGYYDTFYGYKCNCLVLPKEADSQAITGAYAYGHEWDLIDEEAEYDGC
jgi:hypothetical protein